MTAKAVADGKMTDESLGAFTRRTDEIKRRLNEGTLSLFLVMRDLQIIVERKPLMIFEPWRVGVGMNRGQTPDYIVALRKKGYFIGKETEKLLIAYSILPMPYYADFAKVDLHDLGLDEATTYKKLRERAYELVTYEKDFTGTPTIEAGLSLALDLNLDDIKYGEEIVVVTDPFWFEEKEYLLTIYPDTESLCIILKEVKDVEQEIAHSHSGGALWPRFALVSTPYYKKKS